MKIWRYIMRKAQYKKAEDAHAYVREDAEQGIADARKRASDKWNLDHPESAGAWQKANPLALGRRGKK